MNNKILIISDVDGTLCQEGITLTNRDGEIRYLSKTYEQHLGVVNGILKDFPNIVLEFISNGRLGAIINREFFNTYFKKPYHLCNSMEERAEVIKNIIDRNQPDTVFYITDLSSELKLFTNIEHPNIIFITDTLNFDIYGSHLPEIYKTYHRFSNILTIPFKEGHILLRTFSMIANNLSFLRVGFKRAIDPACFSKSRQDFQ